MLLLEMMFQIPKTEKTSPTQTSSPFSTETKPPAAEKKPLIRGNKKKPVNLVYVGGEKHDKVITYINIFTATQYALKKISRQNARDTIKGFESNRVG